MPIRFLSDDWAAAVQDALNAHGGFKRAIASSDLTLQFNTSDGPDGDVVYYLKAESGAAQFGLGELEEPDVTVAQDYETALGISKGELNTQTAFLTGKIKVSGNLAKLMMNQAAITQWQAAVSEIDVEY